MVGRVGTVPSPRSVLQSHEWFAAIGAFAFHRGLAKWPATPTQPQRNSPRSVLLVTRCNVSGEVSANLADIPSRGM